MIVVAGPCLAECPKMMEDVAAELTEGTAGLGIDYYFKASFDKANRKDINAARGPGFRKGMEYLGGVTSKFGIKAVTDVHTVAHCNAIARDFGDVVGVIQIPAGLCRQTDLLMYASMAAWDIDAKINIKKGTALPAKDMEKAATKAMSHYVEKNNVWLCERGTAFGYGDLIVDMRNLAVMHETGHPVIFDCTHSTNKQSKYAPALARAAAATGYTNGFFMEVHPNPSKALCDGPCMLTPAQAVRLIKELKGITSEFS
jgi:2-dehydro-3-deoxyphosphooctonate aldolase (KDO 8-P synthase)